MQDQPPIIEEDKTHFESFEPNELSINIQDEEIREIPSDVTDSKRENDDKKLIFALVVASLAILLFVSMCLLVFYLDILGYTQGGGNNYIIPGNGNDNYFNNTEKHLFTIQDLIRTDRISHPIPSPSGNYIAFTRYIYKYVNKTKYHIYHFSFNY